MVHYNYVFFKVLEPLKVMSYKRPNLNNFNIYIENITVENGERAVATHNSWYLMNLFQHITTLFMNVFLCGYYMTLFRN